MPWTPNELERIGATDDLHVSPFREDGTTPGTPTWVWSVVVGDRVYARAYHGLQSRWYQAAVTQRAGQICAAGFTRDVTFEPVPASGIVNDAVDAAYRQKYQGSEWLPSMLREPVRAATVACIAT